MTTAVTSFGIALDPSRGLLGVEMHDCHAVVECIEGCTMGTTSFGPPDLPGGTTFELDVKDAAIVTLYLTHGNATAS